MCKINTPKNNINGLELQFHIQSAELFSNRQNYKIIRIGIIITKDIRKDLLDRKIRKIFEEEWWNKSIIAYKVRHLKSIDVLIQLYEISMMPPYAYQAKLFRMRWQPNLIRIMRNNHIWKKELKKREENTPSASESSRE